LVAHPTNIAESSPEDNVVDVNEAASIVSDHRVPIHYSSGSSVLHPAAGVGALVVTTRRESTLPSNSWWGIKNDACHDLALLAMETREKKWKADLEFRQSNVMSLYRSEKLHDNVGSEFEDEAIQQEMARRRVNFSDEMNNSAQQGTDGSLSGGVGGLGKFKEVVKRSSVQTTRAKLRSLGDFVRGHGIRKIMMGWNLIEPRFAKSNFSKIVMMKDNNGLSYPMKVQVLPISQLIGIVCTPKVKVYSSELDEILVSINCTPEEILLGKRIAAVRTLMGPKQGEGMNPYEVNELMKFLHSYLKTPERMITLDELMDQVFAKDPAKREVEIANIEKERDQMVVAMLETKRAKEEKTKLLEGRRLRGIESFEETLKEIQFVRAPFTFRRSYQLEDLQKYCTKIIYLKEEAEGVAELPMEHIMLIGQEYFPDTYQSRIQEWVDQQNADNASESTKDSKLSKQLSAAMDDAENDFLSDDEDGVAHSGHNTTSLYVLAQQEKERMKDKKYCKVNLVGPPTYVDMLRKIVSYGRGFDGSSYRDVIELLQAYCAIRIQCMYRGAHLRLRYFEARRRWRAKFAIIKRQHFQAWSVLCKHLRYLKRHCWRKLKAWQWYYRCAYHKRQLFQSCYWPFYVWRRETIRQATLTHKVKFLVTRVYPTYVQLIHFRGWKRFTKYKLSLKMKADTYWHSLEHKAMRVSLLYLHHTALEKKKLKHIWMKGGISKLRRTLQLRKSTPFQIWYAYSYYRRSIRQRAHTYAISFRHLLLPAASPVPAPSKAHRRQELQTLRQERIKSIILENRKVTRERKRIKEEKKKKAEGSNDGNVAGSSSSVSSSASKRNNKEPRASTIVKEEDDAIDTTIDPQSKEYSNASKIVDMDGQERLEKHIQLRNGVRFEWKCSTIRTLTSTGLPGPSHPSPFDFDLDSDCDDVEDIPDTVNVRYLELTRDNYDDESADHGKNADVENMSVVSQGRDYDHCEALYGPESIYRVKWIDNWVVDRVRSLQRGFLYAEMWAVYETALRFHRLGSRVFHNLRVHAVVNRNARLSCNAYALRLKRLIFNSLLRWMLRDAQGGVSSDFNISDQTDGERLREAVRNIRWSKMLRRRELTQQIKDRNEQDPDSAPQEIEYWSDIEPEETRKKTQRLKEIRRYQKWSQEYEDNSSPSHSPNRQQRQRQRQLQAGSSNPNAPATTPKSAGRKSRASRQFLADRSNSVSPVSLVPLSPGKMSSALTVSVDGVDAANFGLGSHHHKSQPGSPEEGGKVNRKAPVMGGSPPGGIASKPNTAGKAQASKRQNPVDGRKQSAATITSGLGHNNHDSVPSGHPAKTPKAKRKMTNSPVVDHMDHMPAGTHDVYSKSVDSSTAAASLTGLPNILTWDRDDRNADNTLSENLLTYSKSIRQKSVEASIESELVAGALSEAIETRDSMVQEVMNTELASTEEAIDLEIAYSRNFKLDAARIMLEVLYGIRIAVLDNLLKVEMKKYFRILRLPMLLRRSRAMCSRKRIINWLRICRRLRSLSTHANYYYTVRTKWILFNRWLKYLERDAFITTPGLKDELRRRGELIPKYSDLLSSRGIKPIVYHNSLKLRHASSDLRATFARWQYYTQSQSLFKKLKYLVMRKYLLNMVQKCFYALKTFMLPSETRKDRQLLDESTAGGVPRSLPLLRLEQDIQQISKRFISKLHRTLVYVVRRYNIYFNAYVKKYGRKSTTFKQFVINYDNEINRRLATEQRILVDAFERRGLQSFVDLLTPSNSRHPAIPEIMVKVEGSKFVDPSPNARYFTVPGAKSMKTGTTSAISSLFASTKNNLQNAASGNVKTAPAVNLTATTTHPNLTPVVIDADTTEMPEITPGSLIGLPAGFKLNKIRVTFGDHTGVAGWQLNWSADGIRDIDGPRRGHWLGSSGNNIQELIVPRGDFAVGIEYYHDGSALMGLRLKLFNGGWTKWVGGKSSLSTQSVYLGVELSDKQPFEDEHVPAGLDEVNHPAYPREYIIGFSGIQTLTRVTNLTLVVRKVKEQYLLSYFWVKDALDKILYDMYENVKEKWLEHTQNILAFGGGNNDDQQSVSSSNGGGSRFLPSIKNNGNLRRASYASSIPDTARSESNKSDSGLGGGNSSSRMNPNTARLRDPQRTLETLDELNSLDESNSDNMETGSVSGASHNSDSQSKGAGTSAADEEMKTLSFMSKYSFSSGIVGLDSRKASESQFFDIMRMRALEVTVAKDRGMNFARKLWTDKDLRANPDLKKLTTVTMVRGLTMWYFNAISKRLTRLVTTEAKGNALLQEARSLRKKSELLQARAAGMKMIARNMENTPQSWAGKSLLSPAERALRKVYKDKIRTYYVEAKAQEDDAEAVSLDALNTEKAGRNLLPRMQLSKYTVNVFLRKLAAARHKETLLQYISVDTVKAALTGVAEKSSGLPTSDMETIINCLNNKADDNLDVNALESLVEREVQKERQRRAKGTSSLPYITIRTLGGKTITAPNDYVGNGGEMEELPAYMTQPVRRKRVLAVDPQHQIIRKGKGRLGQSTGVQMLSKSQSALPLTNGAANNNIRRIPSAVGEDMFRRGGSIAASSLSTLSAFDDEEI
jgi:hypothetical protein